MISMLTRLSAVPAGSSVRTRQQQQRTTRRQAGGGAPLVSAAASLRLADSPKALAAVVKREPGGGSGSGQSSGNLRRPLHVGVAPSMPLMSCITPESFSSHPVVV